MGFIADFFCHKAGLVLEVDGGVNQSAEQREYDARRDKVFSELGLRVIRFRNAEIEKALPAVCWQGSRSWLEAGANRAEGT